MSIEVLNHGFSFSFDGRMHNYSYDEIRKRVKDVQAKHPDASISEQLGYIAQEFSQDYTDAVGISKDVDLVIGIAGVLLGKLLHWFSEFVRNAIDKAIHAGRALMDLLGCFFDWVLGFFS